MNNVEAEIQVLKLDKVKELLNKIKADLKL